MKVYRVTFSVGDHVAQEYYFSSIAAIYQMLTPEEIGCSAKHLYNIGVPKFGRWGNDVCRVVCYRVHSKRKCGSG